MKEGLPDLANMRVAQLDLNFSVCFLPQCLVHNLVICSLPEIKSLTQEDTPKSRFDLWARPSCGP